MQYYINEANKLRVDEITFTEYLSINEIAIFHKRESEFIKIKKI